MSKKKKIRKKSSNKTKCIWVRWLDASGYTGNFIDRDEIPNSVDRGMFLESAGVLITSDKKGILLAQDFESKRNRFREILCIPREYIIKSKLIT